VEISATSPVSYTNYFPKIEYDTRTVKTTIKINDDKQQETVWTYDKYGRLQSTVIHTRSIAEV